MAQILVFGNEKGGAGKSSLAMHVGAALLQSGGKLGVIDLDLRQLTLQRFFENRHQTRIDEAPDLPMPSILDFAKLIQGAKGEPQAPILRAAIEQLSNKCDFVVIDCPGALTDLSAEAHRQADKLITPMNDSFIDFDLLAKIDKDGATIKSVSIYAEMVWKARQARASQGKETTDWVVVRNRLASQQMHNKRKVGAALDQLAKRIGFRLVAGLSDRVVYKELFPRGLTIADPKQLTALNLSLSNIAARQELRDLLIELNLEVKPSF